MSGLAKALEDYLALRRALGFKLRHTARELPRFVKFLKRERTPFVTTALALRWAQEDPDASSVTQSDRLAMVRRFAAWRSAADGRTEIPPHRLLTRRYRRPAPYIYSDAEVVSIVTVAASLPSPRGLRGLACSTVFGLLASTRMSNWRQPGSLTEAAPFSLIAARNLSNSAGTISSSMALTKVAADCADARWPDIENEIPPTTASASAADIQIDLSI